MNDIYCLAQTSQYDFLFKNSKLFGFGTLLRNYCKIWSLENYRAHFFKTFLACNYILSTIWAILIFTFSLILRYDYSFVNFNVNGIYCLQQASQYDAYFLFKNSKLFCFVTLLGNYHKKVFRKILEDIFKKLFCQVVIFWP